MLAPDRFESLSHLPGIRGKMRKHADLSKVNWFRVGGTADILFKPEDAEDLGYFLATKPDGLPVTVLGVGSNLLVRDGGIEGVVVRLGAYFAHAYAVEGRLTVGAGCLNSNATLTAQMAGIGGLEFLSGIPGSIGGALAMNAGAYGTETKDVLIEAELLDPRGNLHVVPADKIDYRYRSSGLPEGWIFIRAVFQGEAEDPAIIARRMAQISAEREAAQPVRARTGGSTFKNPEGDKAWRLIDAAGCRGLQQGGAQVSEKHCNFLINTGEATARDLETLGETVRERVLAHSGVQLEWEIKRIGRKIDEMAERAVA